MYPEFIHKLKYPPKSNRPIPFWSWNERLSKEETRRQIAEMDRAGIGGYFMHARGGLQTEYMGKEWMENIQVGVEEARLRGMGAWAYDENGWPSGFGDGRVNGRGEIYQQKYLRFDHVAVPGQFQDARTITYVSTEEGSCLRFFYEVNPFYVDTLDPTVTHFFLEEIYLPYAQRFEEYLGDAMPGFFTDEPQISRNGIPWSLILPTRYEQVYGEDLLGLLPHLFFPLDGHKRTRYRFWHLVQELFVTSFTEQIFLWCEKHGCQLTGHMVLEETLHSQITSNAAVMPHYEFFHMPGMDWLGRHVEPSTTPLQVASVCHQLGHKRILSETFALTGWNVSFEELKWIYEWQMVRGVTHLCQHLAGYSLRGIRKRDYPPSLFYQQPWWDQYKAFNDAMSRIGMLLSEGIPRYEVLLLHPQSSAWICFDNQSNAGLDALNDSWMRLTRALEQAHIPFHYGDERILRRHGTVDGTRLRVGHQAYHAVLVPPIETLDKSTARLLLQFARAGGTLIWVNGRPSLLEGEPSDQIEALIREGIWVETDSDAVDRLLPRFQVGTIQDPSGSEIHSIAFTWRDLPETLAGESCRFYFMANADQEKTIRATITLPGKRVIRFHMEDGSLQEIFHRNERDKICLQHTFSAMGSLALFVTEDPQGLRIPSSSACSSKHSSVLPAELFQGEWDLDLLEPNALALDRCSIDFDGELKEASEHISVVQSRALSLGRPVDLKLSFPFQVAHMPLPPFYLVMESPNTFQIQVNGRLLDRVLGQDSGYYRDISFRRIEISKFLREGPNEITLRTRFEQSPSVMDNLERAKGFEAEKNKLTYDTEIEAVYLVGNFGVRTPGNFETLPRHAMRYSGPFEIDILPRRVVLGDLTSQGFPFFNGSIRLRKNIYLEKADTQDRIFRLKNKRAQIVSLTVNDHHAATWLWGPLEANLNGLLREGDNRFELVLTGDLRNLLGPHHLQEGESYSVAPCCFFKEPNIWGHLPWNDDTCFVQFGVWV